MEEIILQQKQVIATLFKDKMVPVFLNKTTAHHVAMQKIEVLQQKISEKKQTPQNKFDTFKELNTYKTALENCITTYFDTLNKEALFFNTYFEALDTHLTTLDETIIRTQDQERFVGLEVDSKVLKFKKALKYNAFKVSKIPLKTINLFKKRKKQIVFWKQEIPFKNITSHYFKTNLVADLAIVNDVVNKEINQITEAYWVVDRAIDVGIENYLNADSEISFPDDLFVKLADLPSLETRLEQQKILLNDIFENTSINYTNALYKADTIELSANSFQLKKIENHLKNTEEKSSKNQKLWQNTFNVLESDWELDIEIYKIIFNLMFTYNTLENSISKRIENVYLELEEIKKYLSETKATIANTENNKAVKQTIIAQIKKDTKAFKKIIDETTKRISNQELPLQVNYFEENALQVLQTLSKKRAISSDTDYTTKTATTSINYISPFEIVSYQSWPNLAAQIKEAKLDLSSKVTTFIEDINAINQVNEFNLESALSLFETETQENTSKENTPKKVALEGLGRSEEKVEELKNTLTELNTTNANLLLPSIDKFNKSILELTDTENILEIRLTIAKAKSIEKSKLLKKQFINNVKNFVPVAVGYTKNKYTKTAVRIKNLLIRTGLYKETANVDSHLSDFLKQAEKALGALPYVYQRLFRSETLQNEALFIGRKAALQTLDEAYQTFQKKHYAATIIIGERGSGKTSVIYHFLEQNKKTPKTV
ncbi:ATP-binding protein, partial [Polaribacter sp.]|uniref:ATP-binding protein n=1 Tax=Polaribacter sp. TaxID=1920175 RepID=UPI003F6A5C8A